MASVGCSAALTATHPRRLTTATAASIWREARGRRSPRPRGGGGGGRGKTSWSGRPGVEETTSIRGAVALRAARRQPSASDGAKDDRPEAGGVGGSVSSSSSPSDGDAAAENASSANAKAGYNDDGTKLKWMEILEESAEYDPEIKALLDGVGNDPKAVEDRIRQRFESRKERIYQEREGSTVPMLVKFKEFKSHNLWIWLESHNKISEMEQPLLDEVFKAWFVLGKLGGFNSENMQVQANFYEVGRLFPSALSPQQARVCLHQRRARRSATPG